jgi:hypothetical protein
MATNTTTVEESDVSTDESTCLVCGDPARDSGHTLHLRRDSDGWYQATAPICDDCTSEVSR